MISEKKKINFNTFMAKWTNEIPESEIRRLLRFQGRYYFAGGKPGSIPIEVFTKIMREVADDHDKKWRSGDNKNQFEVLDDYNYGETAGKKYLKEVLARRLKEKEKIDVAPEDVIITSGSQQAIYSLLDCTINPGDMIIAPRPAYLGFLGPAVKLGAEIVTVPTDLDGIVPEMLEDSIEQCIREYHRVPKIIYVVGYSDNPKGTTLPEKRKKAIFDIAEKYNCLIVDDEAYKYIQYDEENSIRPIKRYDDDNTRVAYLSTTSKEAAVFRLGYSVVPEPLKVQMLKSKGYLDLCTSALLQRIATIYYEKYIDDALKVTLADYKIKRDTMVKGIEEHFPEGDFTRPTGGFFIWWEAADKSFKSKDFLEKHVMKEDILYVPGRAFHPVKGLAYNDGKIVPNIIETNGMRICYSFTDTEIIADGIEKLGNILSAHME
ncbi:MAG: aminotransferase-like domain-containing protein [Candidatus Hodarchaeales archaeon]|jgi:DNA-binding transcriptional MocR family regulator